MKLYHGTTEAALAGILREGIKPRGAAGGNWKHTIESNPEYVYLTDAYAIYFAGNAHSNLSPAKRKDVRCAVIEVDLSPLDTNLCPDEDYLEQATRTMEGPKLAPKDKSMNFRTRWYRKRLYSFGWAYDQSLKGLGTATYFGTVPKEHITRVALFDDQAYMGMVMSMGIDPMINLINYRIMGAKYRNSIRWLFGDEMEEDPGSDQLQLMMPPDAANQMKRAREEIKANIELMELEL